MTVYFTDEHISGEVLAQRIAAERLACADVSIVHGAHGKPAFGNAPPFFSASHAGGRTFVVFSSEEVGLDAEWRRRPLPHAYLARLSPAEREEDFFRLWTAKEAYVKFRGGTLAQLLPSLRFEGDILSEGGTPLPLSFAFWEDSDYTLCVCTRTPQEIEVKNVREK